MEPRGRLRIRRARRLVRVPEILRRERETQDAESLDTVARAYFWLATGFLMLLALVLLGWAAWEMLAALFHGEVLGVLESVGLVIIGFAIVETSRFIAEEEIVRRKELRSAVEARRSLTKFITIIVIAASLEALVMIFEASRTDARALVLPGGAFRGVDVRAGRARSVPVAVEPDRRRARHGGDRGEDALDHHDAEREE